MKKARIAPGFLIERNDFSWNHSAQAAIEAAAKVAKPPPGEGKTKLDHYVSNRNHNELEFQRSHFEQGRRAILSLIGDLAGAGTGHAVAVNHLRLAAISDGNLLFRHVNVYEGRIDQTLTGLRPGKAVRTAQRFDQQVIINDLNDPRKGLWRDDRDGFGYRRDFRLNAARQRQSRRNRG
jgi:hypothetical protein